MSPARSLRSRHRRGSPPRSTCLRCGVRSESQAEIEAAVGAKPHVFGSSTGAILVVGVQFSEVPSWPVPQLEAISRAAIVREYKNDPTSLTIAFVSARPAV